MWLDVDPDGLRATRTAVVDVRPDGDGWLVETLIGTERVDGQGEGPQLVPLDGQLQAEFEERESSFVLRSTADDRDLEQGYDWQRYDQDRSLDQEHRRDLGPER